MELDKILLVHVVGFIVSKLIFPEITLLTFACISGIMFTLNKIL